MSTPSPNKRHDTRWSTWLLCEGAEPADLLVELVQVGLLNQDRLLVESAARAGARVQFDTPSGLPGLTDLWFGTASSFGPDGPDEQDV